MPSISSIVDHDILSPTLQKGLYALAACSVIGAAAYIGYRAAKPENEHTLHHRHPELNEEVREHRFLIKF